MCSSIVSRGDLEADRHPLACPLHAQQRLCCKGRNTSRGHTSGTLMRRHLHLSCSRWPMHNQLCLRQAQAWGHERTGPSVLQQGNFPAHKRCSVRKNCYTLHHLFTILLSQVEEQPIHTVSEHAELEGRARTFSRDDQAPPRRHRYSKPFLRTDFIDSVSYSRACLCMN